MATHTDDLARPRARRPVTILTARLPIYLRLMLLASGLMAVLVLGWTLPLRQNAQVLSPFSEFEDILPGQPQSAVIARQFSCRTTGVSDKSAYCTHAPADGPFSLVTVILAGGSVSHANFIVRNGAVLVGAVSSSWGRPEVHVFGQSILLDWPDIEVKAGGRTPNRQFSYFTPIHRILFNSPPESGFQCLETTRLQARHSPIVDFPPNDCP